MIREILFRGKRLDNEEWAEGGYYGCEKRAWIVEVRPTEYGRSIIKREVGPSTVGQFTGLTDKNGKRIFEGDILRTHSGLLGKITFGSFDDDEEFYPGYGWYWDGEDNRGEPYHLALNGEWNGHQIVGNAHDNPELLSGV